MRKTYRKKGKRKSLSNKKKVSRFGLEKDVPFDYKTTRILAEFLTETGKIVPRRVSGLTQHQQLRLVESIKRARQLALLPYTIQHAVRD